MKMTAKKSTPVIIFDVHGVVIGGDLVLERPYELPGTRRLIARLRKFFRVVAMTNVGPDMWPVWNSRYNLTELFDHVYWSGKMGVKKPQPEAFNHVLKDLGIKANEAVIFDNTQSNVEGAKKLGIRGFVFKGTTDAENQLKKLGLKF